MISEQDFLVIVRSYVDSQEKKTAGNFSMAETQHLRTMVKEHLEKLGWEFWLGNKKTKYGTRQELRYRSPEGKSYLSLNTACKGYLQLHDSTPKAKTKAHDIGDNKSQQKKRKMMDATSPRYPQDKLVDGRCEERRADYDSSQMHSPDNANGAQFKKRMDVDSSPTHLFDKLAYHLPCVEDHTSPMHPSDDLVNQPMYFDWFFDGDIIPLYGEVKYESKIGGLTRVGVQCECCGRLFSL